MFNCVSVCVYVCLCTHFTLCDSNSNGSVILNLDYNNCNVYGNSSEISTYFLIFYNTNCQVIISALKHGRELGLSMRVHQIIIHNLWILSHLNDLMKCLRHFNVEIMKLYEDYKQNTLILSLLSEFE